MKAVFLWELMRRRFFVLWWTIGISALISMTILAYVSFKNDTKELNSTFSDLSGSAGMFFGGTDFFSPVGYLSSQIYYIMLPILLIIMVTTLASSLMNRDENDATIELVLARPISRSALLCAKALAALTILSLVGILTYGVTVASVNIAGITIDQGNLLLTHALSFGFALSFGAISFALMAWSQVTRKIATVIAIVASFGSYIVSSLAGFVDWLELPAKLMPYHYFDTAALLGGHIATGLIVYLIGIFIASTALAAFGYSRRDIG